MAAFTYDNGSKIMTSLKSTTTVEFKADTVKNATLGGIAWIKASGQESGMLIRRVSDMTLQWERR